MTSFHKNKRELEGAADGKGVGWDELESDREGDFEG
jgi:hypothetical protein